MKIRERLSLQFTVLACGLLFVSAIVLYFFAKQSAERFFDNTLKKRAKTIHALWVNVVSRDSAKLSLIDRNRMTRLPGENIIMLDSAESILFSNNDSLNFPPLSPLIKEINKKETVSIKQGQYRILGLKISTNEGEKFYVFVGARPEETEVWLQQLRFIMVAIFVLMLAIVSLTGWVFASRALKPIKKTIREAQSIPATDLQRRLTGSDSQDEIGELVRILNDLLSRIENSVYLQKTFVANVSHEIKNPFTKIMSQIEVTLLRERDKETYRQTLESILEDIREMNLLTKSLLDLSTVRHDPSSYNFMPVRIDEILWEVRDKIQALPYDYRVDFAILSAPDDENKMVVSGNPYLLRTAFENLVENAGKYSYDKFIDIVMNCASGCIEIIISNQGPGIPAEKIPNIFDFGTRIDQVKSTTGYGIGLPLTQRILKIHNAEIRIESEPGIVTKVIVTFQF